MSPWIKANQAAAEAVAALAGRVAEDEAAERDAAAAVFQARSL